MNKIDKDYLNLVQDILDNGVKKGDRTGTGTISVFGRQIRHNMSNGFPLLTTKKMFFKGIVTELLWFLRGDTNIKYLVDNDCHIWVGDCYKAYLKKYEQGKTPGTVNYSDPLQYKPFTQEEFINKIKTDKMFAFEWGELGPIYGAQWRRWFPGGKDQIQNLINDLKTNPDSRRLMVSAWNVGELDQMVLPPCHYGFQVYTRELSDGERLWICSQRHHISFGTNDGPTWYSPDNPDRDKLKWMTENQRQLCNYKNIPTRAISLSWNQRSVDVGLGLPFNIASYGLLLEIIAKEVNMVPDELIGNLGDTHLYLNHVEPIKEQFGRELTLEERGQIFKDMGYICDMFPFNGNIKGEYDGLGIPKSTREPFPLPTLRIKQYSNNEPGPLIKPRYWHPTDFVLENYQSHPPIKLPLSN